MTGGREAAATPAGAARPLLALLVICLGTIAAPLDTAVNIAFPSITSSLGRDAQDIRWVIIAYVLTYSCLLLIFGRLGDLIGYRIVFRAGLLTTTVGLAACAAATTFETLVAGRILQGIGTALVFSCAPALATMLYSERERTRVLGIYTAMIALGAALGPLVGGLLVGWFGWSVVFWARLPLVIAALLLSWLLPRRPGQGRPSGLDPIGSLLLVTALSAILLGMTVPRDLLGPVLPFGIVAGGFGVLVLFVRRQSRRSIPIIRPALFRDLRFSAINVTSIIANFAAFSVVLIGPFYLVRIAKLDVGWAGAVLSLGAIGAMLGSSLAPRLILRLGGSGAVVASMLLSCFGLLAISQWTADTPVGMMIPPLLAHGFGLGVFQVAYTDQVTATLPIADRGVAGSLTMLTRTFGVVGGAAGHTALHRWYEARAMAEGVSADGAFMIAFTAVFLVAAGSVGLAVLVSAIAREARSRDLPPLDRS